MADTELILAAKVLALEPVLQDGQVDALSMNPDGRLRVASKPGFFPTVSAELATVGQAIPVDVIDASNVVLHAKNTGTAAMAAGAFIFEASLDSTTGTDGTWFAIQAVRSNANTIELATGTLALAINAGTVYSWELSVNAFRWFRVRCTTATTANSIATWTIVRGTYATEPIPAIQNHGITGAVTVTPTTPTLNTINSAASTNATIVKNAASTLYDAQVFNASAAKVFVKYYNKATAPVPGTDLPILVIPCDAGSMATPSFGTMGYRFSAGIGVAITAGAASNDTAAVATGVLVSSSYI